MKKLTILLAIVLIVLYAIRLNEPQTRNTFGAIAPQTTNKQLSNYAGVKRRGSEVRALFSLVETLNEHEVFPTSIRYRDVLPNSYEWTAKSTKNINSGDRDTIRDSAYYEVVVQDQLNNDGYLDTIIIRAYSTDYVSGVIVSDEQ